MGKLPAEWQPYVDKLETRIEELEAENEKLRSPMVQARAQAALELTGMKASLEYLRLKKKLKALELNDDKS